MPSQQTCPQCGAQIPIGAAGMSDRCPQCGTNISVPPAPVQQSVVPPTPVPVVMQQMSVPYGDLQQAATYLAMKRTLRGIGIGNIIWGIFLIAFGILYTTIIKSSDVAAMVVIAINGLLGLVFIAEGIWLLAAPSANGLLVAAISMFAAGALSIPRILLVIILVLYGVSLLKRYKKYGPLMTVTPTPIMAEQAGALLSLLLKAKRAHSPNIIEFRGSDAFARHLWRGLLQDNMVIMIGFESRLFGQSIADIYFLPPTGLSIVTSKKALIGKLMKGTMAINNEITLSGTISPECVARYDAWKEKNRLPLLNG
ncbi:MAG TPA: hypothetical protein VHV83_17585 [Armatimonadota bacterium]|nr:hypothetical protein [Armatimonadota bacterium]